MTRGVLIYAFNNGEIDYEAMARWNAKRIKRFLGLETTIISNSEHASAGGTRTFEGVKSQWLNASRSNAWEDSPYDETIVIDADYIVNSDLLLKLFDSPQGFLIHQTVSDASGRNAFRGQAHFGQLTFPQSWATVFYFNRDQYNKSIFDLVKTIKENYSHFAEIYKFAHKPFRNDYAFSIALGIVDGHIVNPTHSIPWPLATTSTDVKVSIENDVIHLQYKKGDRPVKSQVKGLDIHVMHKKSMEAISATS
mgnify:FL=1